MLLLSWQIFLTFTFSVGPFRERSHFSFVVEFSIQLILISRQLDLGFVFNFAPQLGIFQFFLSINLATLGNVGILFLFHFFHCKSFSFSPTLGFLFIDISLVFPLFSRDLFDLFIFQSHFYSFLSISKNILKDYS